MKPVAVVAIGKKNDQERTIMREKTSKACTISNIAEYAQVSRSTVSRVLNNVNTKVPVSAATRAKIDEAVRHFDYTPNANARRLSIRRSYVIGLQVPAHNPGMYVFSDYNLIGAMHGIEKALLETNYRLQILFQGKDYVATGEYLTLLKNKSIDGLLIWGALRDETFLPELRNYPVILLNSLPDKHAGYCCISHDDYAGSYALVRMLLARGARRFLYLGGPERVSICGERERAFFDALSSFDIRFDREKQMLRGDFTYDSARRLSEPHFRRGEALDFDAVVCANDMMATGIYDTAVSTGFVPQQDFLLAGADGVEDCARYDLFTYKCDRFQLGFSGISELIRLIDARGGDVFERRIPPLPPSRGQQVISDGKN